MGSERDAKYAYVSEERSRGVWCVRFEVFVVLLTIIIRLVVRKHYPGRTGLRSVALESARAS